MVKTVIIYVWLLFILFSCSLPMRSHHLNDNSAPDDELKPNNDSYFEVIEEKNTFRLVEESKELSNITLNYNNIAYGKKIFASSIYSEGYEPQCLIDDDPDTCWYSNASGDIQWIILDLESTYTIRTLELEWDRVFHAIEYEIYTSFNRAQWINVKKVTSGKGNYETFTGEAICRYLGLKLIVPNQVNYSLKNLIVRGVPVSLDRQTIVYESAPNLASYKPVAATSASSGNYLPINAVDRDHNTSWKSKTNQNEWLYIDIGKTIELTELIIHWDDYNFATNLAIYVNEDIENKQWKRAAQYKHDPTTNWSGIMRFTNFQEKDNIRYIGIFCNKANPTFSFEINDIEVYSRQSIVTPTPTVQPTAVPTPVPTPIAGNIVNENTNKNAQLHVRQTQTSSTGYTLNWDAYTMNGQPANSYKIYAINDKNDEEKFLTSTTDTFYTDTSDERTAFYGLERFASNTPGIDDLITKRIKIVPVVGNTEIKNSYTITPLLVDPPRLISSDFEDDFEDGQIHERYEFSYYNNEYFYHDKTPQDNGQVYESDGYLNLDINTLSPPRMHMVCARSNYSRITLKMSLLIFAQINNHYFAISSPVSTFFMNTSNKAPKGLYFHCENNANQFIKIADETYYDRWLEISYILDFNTNEIEIRMADEVLIVKKVFSAPVDKIQSDIIEFVIDANGGYTGHFTKINNLSITFE